MNARERLEAYVKALIERNCAIELRQLQEGPSHRVRVAYLGHGMPLMETLRELVWDQANLYHTVQRLDPLVVARAPGLWVPGGKTTSGADITQITHLLLDLDPIRPSGVPATEDQHARARESAYAVARTLTQNEGMRPFAILDTGNGSALLYRVAASPEAYKAFHQTLRDQLKPVLEPYQVLLDEATSHLTQMTRFPYTWNRKGYEYPATGQYHRKARLLYVDPDAPEYRLPEPEPPRQLPRAHPSPSSQSSSAGGWTLERIRDALDTLGIRAIPPQPLPDGGLKIALRECVFDRAHRNCAAIFLSPNGRLGYNCFKCTHEHGANAPSARELQTTIRATE